MIGGPMERGGGPGKSGPARNVWASWVKIKGEFYNRFDFFIEFQWISNFGKILEICIRRFSRNFDVGIFPKFL
jgi:hypothetical protein